MENILPILIADAPEALTKLCGVNLLERLLRILQRLGFRSAIVFSTTPEIIGAELAKRSWARQQIIVHLASGRIGPLTSQLVLDQSASERFLIVPANIYCDARLLAALCAKQISRRTCRFRSTGIRAVSNPESVWSCIGHKGFSLCAFAGCAFF